MGLVVLILVEIESRHPEYPERKGQVGSSKVPVMIGRPGDAGLDSGRLGMLVGLLRLTSVPLWREVAT